MTRSRRRRRARMSIAASAKSPTADAPIAQAITPEIRRASTSISAPVLPRPLVRGKFIFVGDEKFYVRGVTYGAFRPDASGHEYHDLDVIERDFAQMAANGINTVRIPHTTPPRSLLDVAQRHGLRVMVGLSAEQYVGFLVDRKKEMTEIEALIRGRVRECAGHPQPPARQVRAAFATGCAGVFVFSWTDEWYRHGHDVEDWAFGLTRADRSSKPALEAVQEAFADVPFAPSLPWPRISVVVCTYNGARTIRDCFEGLRRLAYPDYEVIVVDDGSTDETAAIARQYDCRLIRTENRGLASARNTGLNAATGEIVAYLDDDAYPDPHWLTYLAARFLSTSHAAVGGPNLAPPGDGPIAECVARAPGGPVHVLLTDSEAEHIPGCNMAFRKTCLEAIGGFDPQFRSAGDDVDVCWQLQDRGLTLGFSPAAMVWHHRRNSLRMYWKQQIGYGRAEAMLERKWPEKYNGPGHVRWAGRIYGSGLTRALRWRRARVYHGIWGLAPYQSLYEPAPSLLGSLLQMPEWHLAFALLMGLSALSFFWSPLMLLLPLLIGAALLPLAQACLSAAHASFPDAPPSRAALLKRRLLTAALHLVQPLARLRGRLKEGLTPWRCRGASQLAPLWPVTTSMWSEHWQAPDQRLNSIATALRLEGGCVLRGGEHDRWDLEVRCGFLGAARLLMGLEDHGGGQFVRLRLWPDVPAWGPVFIVGFAALARGAFHHHAWPAAAVLGLMALLPALRTLQQCTAAMATIARGLKRLQDGGP